MVHQPFITHVISLGENRCHFNVLDINFFPLQVITHTHFSLLSLRTSDKPPHSRLGTVVVSLLDLSGCILVGFDCTYTILEYSHPRRAKVNFLVTVLKCGCLRLVF